MNVQTLDSSGVFQLRRQAFQHLRAAPIRSSTSGERLSLSNFGRRTLKVLVAQCLHLFSKHVDSSTTFLTSEWQSFETRFVPFTCTHLRREGISSCLSIPCSVWNAWLVSNLRDCCAHCLAARKRPHFKWLQLRSLYLQRMIWLALGIVCHLRAATAPWRAANRSFDGKYLTCKLSSALLKVSEDSLKWKWPADSALHVMSKY